MGRPTGEIGRADGLTDIAVAVTHSKGTQLYVFEFPEGALKAARAAVTHTPRVRDRALAGVRTSCIGRTPLLNVGGIVPTVTVRCRGTGGGGRGSVRIRDHGQPAPSHASQPVRTLDARQWLAQAVGGAKGPSSRPAAASRKSEVGSRRVATLAL